MYEGFRESPTGAYLAHGSQADTNKHFKELEATETRASEVASRIDGIKFVDEEFEQFATI